MISVLAAASDARTSAADVILMIAFLGGALKVTRMIYQWAKRVEASLGMVARIDVLERHNREQFAEIRDGLTRIDHAVNRVLPGEPRLIEQVRALQDVPTQVQGLTVSAAVLHQQVVTNAAAIEVLARRDDG